MAEALRTDPSGREPLVSIARRVGASPRTIERIFNDEVRMSFGARRQRLRLLSALELLAHGESVTRAALMVGYETPSSFIAAFRKAFNVTPARYFDTESRMAATARNVHEP